MAQLPPKIPTMNTHWPDFIFSGHHQKLPIPPFAAAAPATDTASTPSQSNSNSNNNNVSGNNNPSWVDEFFDFSHARRGAHRRSASDSIAFLDSASLLDNSCGLDAGTGNNCASTGLGSNADSGSDFERFDGEHFMSMFTDEISLQLVNNNNTGTAVVARTAVSSSNPSTPSDRNSISEEKLQPLDHHRTDQQMAIMKNEVEEVHSPCESDTAGPPRTASAAPSTATANAAGPSERIIDPKRVKRILANRQSAQRSRVRKLQYISELERSVTSLQAEVSVLSPRVAFLDHQRLLLNVDNSALKQRIAALAQDKIFKDAHQEALRTEIERLKQVYRQQNLKNMDNNNGAPGSPQPPAASEIPTAIPIERQQLAS